MEAASPSWTLIAGPGGAFLFKIVRPAAFGFLDNFSFQRDQVSHLSRHACGYDGGGQVQALVVYFGDEWIKKCATMFLTFFLKSA
jgi:hypothetical protein